MYQRIGNQAFKKDLSNTIALLSALGNPHKSYPVIHVAGTNGKGSVCHFLTSSLQQAGYTTGLYTSPHLVDFRERIRVNGHMIAENDVISFVREMTQEIESINPSFFELTVALAFNHFANNKVDVAVIETGLGGRLDSTNVVEPIASVITSIGMDHTDQLGDTIQEIAFEKAGIIKNNTPIIVGPLSDDALEVIKEKANNCNAELINPFDEKSLSDFNHYHEINRVIVANTLETIKEKFNVSTVNIDTGIIHAKENTGWRARWEVLQNNPKVICDIGHNEEAVEKLMNRLNREELGRKHIIWGSVKDKDQKSIFRHLPQDAHYYFTPSSVPRSLPVDTLMHWANHYRLEGSTYPSPYDAFLDARNYTEENDVIFIGGSTFVVADFLREWEKRSL
jgi:dihydrofolate synthase/folylpolyglutamate synthase